MAKKCCNYESYEDGASGRSVHYGGYQDGAGGKGKGRKGGWSREDGSGKSKGESRSPLSLGVHEGKKGKKK